MKEEPSENAKEIRLWQNVAVILRHTTDWSDGTGLAKRNTARQAESIPIESRILAIFLAFMEKWDMTHDTKAAITHVKAQAGARFDPRLVSELEHWVYNLGGELWRDAF